MGITDTKDLKRLIRSEIIAQGACVDLNHIDVSNVGRLNGLFEETLFNGDMSNWNVTNAVTASDTHLI